MIFQTQLIVGSLTILATVLSKPVIVKDERSLQLDLGNIKIDAAVSNNVTSSASSAAATQSGSVSRSSIATTSSSKAAVAAGTARGSSTSSTRSGSPTSATKSAAVTSTVKPPSTQHPSSVASSISAKASSISSASASIPSSSGCPSATGDAPYSLSCDVLGSVISFPNGFQNKEGGIVFLVHGTGSTGQETWGSGPYNTILPNKGVGYDIAWFTSPTRSLGDAQVNAEYLAYNIKQLAKRSRTGKVFLIGHSQGNINIQWALKFWPSTRGIVAGFVSLAGDFHGTAEGPLLCTGQDLLQHGCEPSVIQQSIGSHYLAAQNAGEGGGALVSTTSLYTLEDDIIQPEVVNPTSNLPGAAVISIQQACPLYVTDHFGMTVAAPAFYLAYDALTHGGKASLSRFASSECTFLGDSTIPNPFVEVPGVVKQAALDAISVVAYQPKVFKEPKLMSYVCAKGSASSYCS